MTIFIRLLAALFLLSGCYYESPVALHKGMESFAPKQFYRGEDNTFRSDRGDHVIARFSGEELRLIRTSLKPGSTSYTRTIRQIVRDDRMPKGVYLAVYPSSGKYHYFPFYYGKSGIHLMFPGESETVTTIDALRRAVSAANKKRVLYRKLSEAEDAAAYRAYRAIQDAKKNKPATNAPAPATGTPPTAGIARLDVGDGVYVQGFLSDELADVVRIDQGSGQVKVRRRSDGTTTWVHHSKIITRQQATANDVGRVGVGTALVFCLFAPDQCKKK